MTRETTLCRLEIPSNFPTADCSIISHKCSTVFCQVLQFFLPGTGFFPKLLLILRLALEVPTPARVASFATSTFQYGVDVIFSTASALWVRDLSLDEETRQTEFLLLL